MTYQEQIKSLNLKRKHGIYSLSINNNIYVGSAIDLSKRLTNHLNDLKANRHTNIHLQNAFNKYLELSFNILEFIDNPEYLIKMEQHYIDLLKPRYNIAKIAGSMLGFKHSEETKKRISEANLGKKISEQAKKNMSNSRKGAIFSEQHKKNMSKSKIGDKNPFYKAGVNHPQYGTTRSLETLFKISGANSRLSKSGVLYDVETGSNYIFRSLKCVCKKLNIPYSGMKNAMRGKRFYKEKWFGDFLEIPKGIETKINK